MAKSERGAIAVIIVMLLSLISFIPIGMQLIRTSRQEIKQHLNYSAQAENAARAGLIDALSWFKRQPLQPVSSIKLGSPFPDAAFAPQSDPDPAVSATLDSSIGLVNEFPLGANTSLWARYELRRQTDPATPAAHAVRDVTDRRIEGLSAGEGLVWSLESCGYIYRNPSQSTGAFRQENILARSRVATEIRRLGVAPPEHAAVIVNDQADVSLVENAEIIGNNKNGLAFYTTSGLHTMTHPRCRVLGTDPTKDMDGTNVTPLDVFGVTATELRLLADYNVPNTAALPTKYPNMALVFINGNASFNSAKQLSGGGVLYVQGNLDVQSGAEIPHFVGLIYVDGDAAITGRALVSGSMIVTGRLTLTGTPMSLVSVSYDESILNLVGQQIGQYRENKSTYHIFSANK